MCHIKTTKNQWLFRALTTDSGSWSSIEFPVQQRRFPSRHFLFQNYFYRMVNLKHHILLAGEHTSNFLPIYLSFLNMDTALWSAEGGPCHQKAFWNDHKQGCSTLCSFTHSGSGLPSCESFYGHEQQASLVPRRASVLLITYWLLTRNPLATYSHFS